MLRSAIKRLANSNDRLLSFTGMALDGSGCRGERGELRLAPLEVRDRVLPVPDAAGGAHEAPSEHLATALAAAHDDPWPERPDQLGDRLAARRAQTLVRRVGME